MKPPDTRSRIRVSVCANTSTADVTACIAGGADAVGVLVGVTHVAEDAVSLTRATEILSGVPPYIGRYAVTHLTDFAGLLEIATVLPIDILQVHAEPEPAVIARLRNENPSLRIIKAVHIAPDQRPDWEPYIAVADAFILDSIDLSADRIGGTGQVHDWSISAAVAMVSPHPVILAGGLRPENVRRAVSQVRPWAVNVNSGVESDGYKDVERIRTFVREVNQFSHSIKDSD